MIDVHCHLNFKSFANDYDEVIKQASEAGVTTIINVGTKLDSSKKAVELASKYDNLYAIVGVHPHHADKLELEQDWIEQLEKLAGEPKVVAIGEIGMDYYRYKSNGITDPKQQRDVFEKQIELSHKVGLPLQIHNRHAGNDILEVLSYHKSSLKSIPGMFHCFSGNIDFLKKVLDLGFYVGFDGNITYEGIAPGEGTLLSDIAQEAPIDRIVVETDSPYLTPIPHRGSRNTPAYGILVGEFIAKIKNLSLVQIDEQTTKNARLLFGI